MAAKTVIIVGAGSTFSDVSQLIAKRDQPPLDRGFFEVYAGNRSKPKEFMTVQNYLQTSYRLSALDSARNSLEGIMTIIYSDLRHASLTPMASDAFRDLVRLLNNRISQSTNRMKVTNQGNLYRIVAQAIDSSSTPSDISIITFNQDLHAEKVLAKLQDTAKHTRKGAVYSFPYCYRVANAHQATIGVSSASQADRFAIDSTNQGGIRLLKLHGSLNWFSLISNPSAVTASFILDRTRPLRITPRSDIELGLKVRSSGQRMDIFPLIMPPISPKSNLVHQEIEPLWDEAEHDLRSAEEVIVFGYSCPVNDAGSVDLLRWSISKNATLQSFSIIDPDPGVVARYANVTNFGHLLYFSTTDDYIRFKRKSKTK